MHTGVLQYHLNDNISILSLSSHQLTKLWDWWYWNVIRGAFLRNRLSSGWEAVYAKCVFSAAAVVFS